MTFAAPPTTLSDVVAPFLASRPADGGASPTPNVVARASEDIFAALDEGADVVVAPVPAPSGLASMLIAELPVRAYVGSHGTSHEASRSRDVPRTLSLETLAATEPLLVLPGRYPVRKVLARALEDAGLAPAHLQEVDSPEAAQAIAASGRGVAVLTNDPRFGLIPRRIVDAAGEVLTLPLYAAWRSEHHGADELAALAQDLREFCARQYAGDLA